MFAFRFQKKQVSQSQPLCLWLLLVGFGKLFGLQVRLGLLLGLLCVSLRDHASGLSYDSLEWIGQTKFQVVACH